MLESMLSEDSDEVRRGEGLMRLEGGIAWVFGDN